MTLAVNYSVMGARDGSCPTDSYGWKGGSRENFKIKTRWSDRKLAIRQCTGYSIAATVGGKRVLRRELPEIDPEDSTMFCTRAATVGGLSWTGRSAYDKTTLLIKPGYPNKDRTKDPGNTNDLDPRDNERKTNVFKRAVIQLELEQADFFIRDDTTIDVTYAGQEDNRFVSYRDDASFSFFTIQGGTLYYVLNAGNVAGPELAKPRLIPFGVGRPELKKSIYLTWHQVASEAYPTTTIDNMIGKVNSKTYNGFSAGTLLFLPPKKTRYVMPNGGIGIDTEFVFEWFKEGQNKILRSAKDAAIEYLYITTDSTIIAPPVPGALPVGKTLFAEDDFAKVFDCNNP